MPTDELSLAQARLGRALGLARAGEDRELAQKIREGGEAMVHLFGGLLKMSHIHRPDNRAFEAPALDFSRALCSLHDLLGAVHLVAVDDQVYVNELRIRAEGTGSGREVGPELARHNAGGATFHAPLEPAEVRGLVTVFSRKPAAEARRRALQQALFDAGLRTVELTPRFRFRMEDEAQARDRAPAEALQHTVRLVEETYDNLASGRVLNPLPLRRAVAELVELGPELPELWERIQGGAPHATHATSVALVALLVGKALGLRAGGLQDLGLAALVHDIGYAALPPSVAAGPDGLQHHPAEGARLLLKQRGFHEAKLRRLRAVMDHHRDHADPRTRPSLHGQILRLAEDYTTCLRVFEGRVSPADVLGAMLRAPEQIYHPGLMQLMVNALGRYPPGTLLELEDGRCVRSVSPVRGPETFAAPLVRLLDPETHAPPGERLDLASGGKVRRVLPG